MPDPQNHPVTTPASRLAVHYRPVQSLIPYARNARTHSPEQVAQIAASIREFGWTNPILLDGDQGVIAGHGRLLAARQLGLDEVPVIELAHLNDTQRRAYVLADNRLAENAGWDAELLRLELGELQELGFDLDLTGFGPDELEALAGTESPDFAPGTADDQGKLDELAPVWVCCPKCGSEFNVREA